MHEVGSHARIQEDVIQNQTTYLFVFGVGTDPVIPVRSHAMVWYGMLYTPFSKISFLTETHLLLFVHYGGIMAVAHMY